MKKKTETIPLRTYLAEEGISALKFARDNGFPIGTVYNWIYGRCQPRKHHGDRVKEATGGRVTVDSIAG